MARALELINADFEKGGLVGNRRGGIQKNYYSLRAGISPSSLSTSPYREIVGEIEANYRGSYVPEPGTQRSVDSANAQRLLDILRQHVDEGTLVRGRGDKVDKKHYATLLGFKSAQNKPWFEAALTIFHGEHQVETSPRRHLSAMRQRLERGLAAGTLNLRAGKVRRDELLNEFGLSGGNVFTRYPEFVALFDEFDQRVRNQEYLNLSDRVDLHIVDAALLQMSPHVRKGLKVNLHALSRETGLSVGRLQRSLFAEVIAKHQARLDKELLDNPYFSYVHDAPLDFSHLNEAWSPQFVARLVKSFEKAMAPLVDGPQRKYRMLVDFLSWIASGSSDDSQKVMDEARNRLKVADEHAWRRLLLHYRNLRLAAPPDTHSSVSRELGILRATINALQPFGVLPEATFLGIKNARADARVLPTLVEPKLGAASEAYIEFAKQIFNETCKTMRLQVEDSEASDFFSFLSQQVGTPPPGDTAARVVQHTLERMLTDIKDAAIEIIKAGMVDYSSGQILLASSEISAKEFASEYFQLKSNDRRRKSLLRQFFPVFDGQLTDRGVANLLRLVADAFGSLFPLSDHPIYGQFFSRRYLEAGGVLRLERMLGPDRDVVGAVLALYHCESGSNIGVARTLDVSCLSESGIPLITRVVSTKQRAKGKPIIYDFSKADFVIEAIEWLQDSGASFRAHAQGDRDRLFTARYGQSVHVLTAEWYREFFGRLTSGLFGQSYRALVPAMLRPSVILKVALSKDGRLNAGMALGQHSWRTTGAYQNRWPTRVLYDEVIRKFHTEVQVVILSAVPEAAIRLGIDEGELKQRLERLSPTGLGTYCLNVQGRPGKQREVCDTLDCWNACPNMLVIAEPESLTALRTWQLSLREVQGTWERDHYERWEKIWLPWLCLADVVEEKMTSDARLVPIWQEAVLVSERLFASPNFSAPRPW